MESVKYQKHLLSHFKLTLQRYRQAYSMIKSMLKCQLSFQLFLKLDKSGFRFRF